ncbi:MAG TPA: cytochrome c [Gemmatimonadaceae bacterium]|nr:cytochrome c [Gemmatimonadaceae bacterium]
MSAELGAASVRSRMRVLLFVAPLLLTACEWFSDFKRQPSLWTWEPVKDTLTPSRGNPQFSVPITGTAVAGFQVSYGAFPATIDSMANLRNPTPSSDASLTNGRKYFEINCTPCHGERAMGDGLATRYGMPGINLTTDMTKARTDGYIFGMIRNGRGLMPPYNRIEEMDRWDIVNYLRALQGAGGKTMEVGPLAPPGVTGDMVPGATVLGPNRPAPFASPRSLLPGAQPTSPAAAQQGLPAGATPAPADTTARARADSARARDSVRARSIR